MEKISPFNRVAGCKRILITLLTIAGAARARLMFPRKSRIFQFWLTHSKRQLLLQLVHNS